MAKKIRRVVARRQKEGTPPEPPLEASLEEACPEEACPEEVYCVEEVCAEEACAEEACAEEACAEEACAEEACAEEACAEEACAEEACAEEACAEEPSAEEPSAEEPSAEEPSAEEPSAEEPSAEEPSAEEPSAEEPSTEEPSAEEPSTEEPSAEEPSAEETCAEETYAEETCAEEPCAEETCAEEPCAEETCAEEPCAEETCAEEPCAEETCAEEPCAEETCAEETCAEEISVEEEPCAKKIPLDEDNRPETSPYTTPIYTLSVGPNGTPYTVPQYFLQLSPKLLASMENAYWNNNNISLPELDESIGHTLVHYLYTGTYQTLKLPGVLGAAAKTEEYRRGILAYLAAMSYGLDGLATYAKEAIVKFDGAISMFETLDIVKELYPKLSDNEMWFSVYLKSKIEAAFKSDETLFKQERFLTYIGGPAAFDRALFKSMVEIYTEKILIMEKHALEQMLVSETHLEELSASEESSASENTSAAEGQSASEGAPTPEAHSAEEGAPATEEEAPATEEEAPATEEEAPTTEEVAPTAEEEAPTAEEQSAELTEVASPCEEPVATAPSCEDVIPEPVSSCAVPVSSEAPDSVCGFSFGSVTKKDEKKGKSSSWAFVQLDPLPAPGPPIEHCDDFGLPSEPEPVADIGVECPAVCLEPEPECEPAADPWAFWGLPKKSKLEEERKVVESEPEPASESPKDDNLWVGSGWDAIKKGKKSAATAEVIEEKAAELTPPSPPLLAEPVASAPADDSRSTFATAIKKGKKVKKGKGEPVSRSKKKSRKKDVKEEPKIEEPPPPPSPPPEPEPEFPQAVDVSDVEENSMCSSGATHFKNGMWRDCNKCRTFIRHMFAQLANEGELDMDRYEFVDRRLLN